MARRLSSLAHAVRHTARLAEPTAWAKACPRESGGGPEVDASLEHQWPPLPTLRGCELIEQSSRSDSGSYTLQFGNVPALGGIFAQPLRLQYHRPPGRNGRWATGHRGRQGELRMDAFHERLI